MERVPEELAGAIAAMAEDRTSGASALLARAIDLLRRAAASAGGEPARVAVARAVARAQPSMGGFWTAAAAALAPPPSGGLEGLSRLRLAVDRAPRAMARLAVETLGLGRPAGAPLRLVTWSASASVVACCHALGADRPLVVSCGEGRPALEGRRLAATLASRGITVRFATDGGVGEALGEADAVLVGADAVLPDQWINKSGTGLLAAAANARGVPVVVVASREKFVAPALAPLVVVRDQRPDEVWPGAPGGVTVVNRYFERIPIAWIATLVTDTAVIDATGAAEACRTQGRWVTPAIVEWLR